MECVRVSVSTNYMLQFQVAHLILDIAKIAILCKVCMCIVHVHDVL
jgi:hypothetical protein